MERSLSQSPVEHVADGAPFKTDAELFEVQAFMKRVAVSHIKRKSGVKTAWTVALLAGRAHLALLVLKVPVLLSNC